MEEEFSNEYDLTEKTLKEVVRPIADKFKTNDGMFAVVLGERWLKLEGKKYYFTPGPKCGTDLSKDTVCFLCKSLAKPDAKVEDIQHEMFALKVRSETGKNYFMFECRVQMKLFLLEE